LVQVPSTAVLWRARYCSSTLRHDAGPHQWTLCRMFTLWSTATVHSRYISASETPFTMSKLQKNASRQSVVSRPGANSAVASLRKGDVQISDPIPVSGGVHNDSQPHPAPNSLHLRSNNSLRLVQPSRNGSTTQLYADDSTRRSPPRLQHKRSMNGLREASNSVRRTPSRSPTESITRTDPQIYAKSTPTKLTGGPKREKSTLKTVMRRLFGKKPAQRRRAAGAGPAEHHRSVSA